MHQPRSHRTALAMKLGALTFLLSCLSLGAAVALFGYSVFAGNRSMALGSLVLFGLTAALIIGYRILAASARCPLCRCPVLAGSGASRNRNARRSLGSHRLRVARDIVLTNSFVCPYCNEATQCTVMPPRSPSGR